MSVTLHHDSQAFLMFRPLGCLRVPTVIVGIVLGLGARICAEPCLVREGVPEAEIVIASNPTRMQRVAAHEFQAQIEKISGAHLRIVTAPSEQVVHVYIGNSPDCPVNADGLEYGAYRLVSGPDWLVLIGDDSDYVPAEPFARGNSDIQRARTEWEQIVGAPYGLPGAGIYKHRLRLPGTLGLPDGVAPETEYLELWGLDERGSFNAVCGYLRSLGARWYLPGELGEVLPALTTIPLPDVDQTVRPDFALRQFNFRFSVTGADTAWWVMRLGLRSDEQIQIAHGLATMTNRDAVFAAHPEWFAVYGGKPDYTPGSSKNQLCYSNPELFDETVRYARAQLDTYGLKTVSIMPPDGYTAICQCEHCRGKDSPERNERGLLSDCVWDFVNRVAREIGKSHPDARVLNCAYGAYTLPPQSIDKLEPNVQVCIVGGRRPINKGGVKAEGESAPNALRAAWRAKTDNPLLIFENYPFTDRGWYLPAFAAHALGQSINATKEASWGEDIWLSAGRDFDHRDIAFNHFLVYFTARMYWGGPDADVDALLSEYCRLFYGPAEQEMLQFFNYCEANWQTMESDKPTTDTALALFSAAREQVKPDTVYARRLELIDEFLEGLRRKSVQLGQRRGPVPVVRLVGDARDIVVDGQLDDAYWQNCPTAATGRLRELQTGGIPTFGTSFQAGWQGNQLYFAIRCDEHPGEPLNNTATRDDDQAIWYGDAIELEIETEMHSYYQIAISPSGVVVDLDRGIPKGQWFGWDSQAEVATHVSDDHWVAEIRIPVSQDENDPLHQVIGSKPTQSLPWHINICRQRIRDDGQELSALSPTGTAGFHEPLKFAHFYDGRSHRFDADPTVTDFAIRFREAERERQASLCLKLTDTKVSDFQRSAALELAARLDPEHAETLITRIPIDAVRKTARMQFLLANRDPAALIAEFDTEDLSTWPFWKRGSGHYLRGRAHYLLKSGAAAERDLTTALEFTGDPRTRDETRLTTAQNREFHLQDDSAAFAAYQAVVEGRSRIGSANEFAALQGMARILTRRGEFDEALRVLNRADLSNLKGTWRDNILKSIEAVQAARQ